MDLGSKNSFFDKIESRWQLNVMIMIMNLAQAVHSAALRHLESTELIQSLAMLENGML